MSGTLSFAAGTSTLNQTVAVTVNGDADPESDETFFLQIHDPSGATLGDAFGRATIANDDTAPPVLSIADATPNPVVEGNSGTANHAAFTVTLSATPTTNVVVQWATMGAYFDSTATSGVDYTAASGSLTFPAGTSTLTQVVSVAIVGDTAVEPVEKFYVQIYNPSGATLNPSVRYGQGFIGNDD